MASPISDEDLLIHQIGKAFAGVTLGGGVGLWQGRAHDDYADDEEEEAEARKRDERFDWTRIPFADLSHCDTSLAFVDAEGMRFLLPVFMIDCIRLTVARENRFEHAMYTVTRLDHDNLSKFIGFDVL